MAALFKRGVACAALSLSAVLLCLQTKAQDSAVEGTAAQRSSERAPDASEQTARDQAQKLFRQALRAYHARRYVEAIDCLLEAHQRFPRPAFLYNLALVYEALGDHASALRWLRDYRRQADDTAAVAEVDGKIRAQERKLAEKGVQQVRVLSNPPGAVVEVDHRRLGLTPHTFETAPGTHRIRLELSGHQAVETEFVLRPERSIDLTFTLPEQPPALPSRTTPLATAPSGALSGTGQVALSADTTRTGAKRVRAWTWAALTASAGGFGGALTFELVRRTREKAAARAAQRDYQDHYDDMRRAQTIARMFAALGTSFAVASGLSLYFDLRRDDSRSTRAGVSGCGTGMCAGIGGQF